MHLEVPPHDLTPDDWAAINETLGLSPRELQVAQLWCNGIEEKNIATRLGISIKTVGSHISRIYGKARVHGQARLIWKVLELAGMKIPHKKPKKPGKKPGKRK